MKKLFGFIALFLFIFSIAIPVQAAPGDQKIFDYADLLTDQEEAELQEFAERLGAERETDFIIITKNDGIDVEKYMADFYDTHGPGYDKKHGNTAIFVIDMEDREFFLAGFYKAEKYLDSSRLDMINERVTPHLKKGDYYKAFELFIKKGHQYMGFRPGVNPENPLFKWWFQIGAGVILGAIVVGLMAYHSGGRVTVSASTYQDYKASKVRARRDKYLHTHVTKTRIPKGGGGSGGRGGGGGGITRGGHSYSGSRGKF